MIQNVYLEFKEKKVPIRIGKNIIFKKKSFADFCLSFLKRIVIITDKKIERLYGKKLYNFLNSHTKCHLISIPSGERYKTRKTKEDIEDKLLKNLCTKETLILALGGGVVLDIAAFVASTFCRGIPLIMIPTTLLAMVDASIGGKTAVNTSFGKNLIGSFYHPEAIFIDSSFLYTLDKKQYRNGLSEIIKYGLISDERLFSKLYKKEDLDLEKIEKIIYRCCQIKKNIVEQDEKEKDIRTILNFGHTIGHSIEHLDNYKISHGEAISIGMIFASYLSYQHGFLDQKEFFKIFSIFKKYDYPLIFSQEITWKKMARTLNYDKKAKQNYKPRFILLEKIGKIKKTKNNNYLHEINNEILKKALIWLNRRFASKKENV